MNLKLMAFLFLLNVVACKNATKNPSEKKEEEKETTEKSANPTFKEPVLLAIMPSDSLFVNDLSTAEVQKKLYAYFLSKKVAEIEKKGKKVKWQNFTDPKKRILVFQAKEKPIQNIVLDNHRTGVIMFNGIDTARFLDFALLDEDYNTYFGIANKPITDPTIQKLQGSWGTSSEYPEIRIVGNKIVHPSPIGTYIDEIIKVNGNTLYLHHYDHLNGDLSIFQDTTEITFPTPYSPKEKLSPVKILKLTDTELQFDNIGMVGNAFFPKIK